MARIINIISTILAVLCLAALLPWLLGVPGVENDYARGWKLGLATLVGFPLTHLVLSLLERLVSRGRLRLRPYWITAARLAALLAFVGLQAWAWSLIMR